MPRHFNPSIANWCQRIFKTKTGDHISSQVGDILVPVMPIQPIANIARHAVATNATGSGMFTTPTDKDFYLTSAALSVIKDATSDSTQSSIQTTIGGVTRFLLAIPGLSLTAQTGNQTITYATPVLVDRGVNISVSNGTATANITARGEITGYTVETASTRSDGA